jgi:hypothetical protein
VEQATKKERVLLLGNLRQAGARDRRRTRVEGQSKVG